MDSPAPTEIDTDDEGPPTNHTLTALPHHWETGPQDAPLAAWVHISAHQWLRQSLESMLPSLTLKKMESRAEAELGDAWMSKCWSLQQGEALNCEKL